jgi:hypothetical protein
MSLLNQTLLSSLPPPLLLLLLGDGRQEQDAL